MAYTQIPLKNIGNLRDKITKRKLDNKFGSMEGAKKFKQIEEFRSRASERSQPKFKTMETSFKSKTPKSKIKTKKRSGGVIKGKSGKGKQALITLGATALSFLAASPFFGTQRGYGAENAKNLGG